jgi:glycosyltransferase involved in cell wall biosynthesis
MRLVYLSPVPWASFAQRPHKFVEWFHSRTAGEVLWVDPYPTRFPSLADLRWPYSTDSIDTHTSPAWLQVLRPLALPFEPLPGAGWFNGLFWRSILNEVAHFANHNNCRLVIGKPSLLSLAVLNRLNGVHSVYDAMDEFPAFYRGISRFAMASREMELIRKVDTLWVSSTKLRQSWGELRPDLYVVRNGLDSQKMPTPGKSAVRDFKVFGYVGTIASWFDWAWVVELARSNPKDVVRLIGPTTSPIKFKLPANIELLPACHHEAALNAMLEFNVGLIPFLRNSLTASVDPIKYYEYRALGLPVVSTDFGEMTFRVDERGTFISKSLLDIKRAITKALEFSDDTESVGRFLTENDWGVRFDATQLLDTIIEHDSSR